MIVSQRASQDCFCQKYLNILAENGRLKSEIERLKAKLARQERTAKEQPFGLSTPSSKQLIKPSVPELTSEEIQRRKGGAPAGHEGHGWKRLDGDAEVEYLSPLDACPCCGGALIDFPGDDGSIRELIDCHPLPAFRRRLRVPARYCPHCRKPVRPRVLGVLPKTRLSNQVLARVAGEHYLDGVPMGTVARRLNVPKGTLFHEMHHLAALLEPAVESLREKFRNAAIKHADETTWRTDGNNGYAWLFTAGPVTLFV